MLTCRLGCYHHHQLVEAVLLQLCSIPCSMFLVAMMAAAANQWWQHASLPPMSTTRSDHTAGVHGGTIYVIGRTPSYGQVEAFCPILKLWIPIARSVRFGQIVGRGYSHRLWNTAYIRVEDVCAGHAVGAMNSYKSFKTAVLRNRHSKEAKKSDYMHLHIRPDLRISTSRGAICLQSHRIGRSSAIGLQSLHV